MAYYKSMTGIPDNFSNDKFGECTWTKVNEKKFPKNLGLTDEATLD